MVLGSFQSRSIMLRWRRNSTSRLWRWLEPKGWTRRHWAAVQDKLAIPPVEDEMEYEDEDVVQTEEPSSSRAPDQEASHSVVAGGAVLPPSSQPAPGAASQHSSGVRDKGKEKVRPAKRRTGVRGLVAGGELRTAWFEELEEQEMEVAEESVPLWAEATFDRLDQLVFENNPLRAEAAVAQAESWWRDHTFAQDRNTNEYSLLVAVAWCLERA
ncbi:hypothetical protein QOT17_009952 [Balamuthia mandrillaris]